MTDPALADLLAAHRHDVVAFIARHAGRLLRYETAEDLAQSVHLRALEHGRDFRWKGREPFLAWTYAVARSHLADRHSYWAALRRRPARLVRLATAGADTRDGADLEPAARATGPSTLASRREQLDIAIRAMAVLLPRDRDLVRWTCEGVAPDEQARRLGIARDAVDRAKSRAMERFRKAYALASAR